MILFQPDGEICTTHDLAEAASNTTISLDNARKAIENYRNGQRRLLARRQAQLKAFSEAHERIRRKKRGWSPLSDGELTARGTDERERARKARNKRDQRARSAKQPTPAFTRLPIMVTKEAITGRLVYLKAWLALPGHRQRHLRERASDIMRAWIVYQEYINHHGAEPTAARFAKSFTARFGQPMSRQTGQKRLVLLGILTAPDGPFAVTPATRVETSKPTSRK